MSFIEELKRRNVFRVGIAYLVVGWLVTQVLDSFGSPEWVMKTILVCLAAGFPFAVIFAWAFEITPEGLKKGKDVDRSQSITHKTGRKLDYSIIAILVLALGYFAYDKFVLDPQRDAALIQTAESASEAEAEPVSTEKSIAVLPFVNMSSDAEQEYFSDGISEEILNALAKIKGLQVTGRTSSFAFKGENQDLRLIGDTLGVDHILEGSVRKSGNTVRITAQLIRVDNGFHLWSETYDRELDNVFAIQDEIATKILQELKATLLAGEETAVTATRTNAEAYDLYLLAKQRLYERTGPTIQAAADLLDRAIAIDPAYAPAYAQRAIATLLLSDSDSSYGDIPWEQAQAQAKLYLDKAVALDPNLAEAWAGFGLYYSVLPSRSDQEKAIEVLQKALRLNPGLIDAHNWLYIAFGSLGKPAEAKKVMLDLIERDPLYRPAVYSAVTTFLSFGQSEQALAYLDQIRPLMSNDPVFQGSEANIFRARGEIAESSRLAESAVERLPSHTVLRGNRAGIWMELHEYERVVDQDDSWRRVFALSHLGRNEEASILAFERANEHADLWALSSFLNMADRSEELIAYLEERWPDMDVLRENNPAYGGLGDIFMVNVALAYSRTGNQARFDQALQYVHTVHQDLLTEGVNNSSLFMFEASYQAMAGDLDASLDYLDRAITQGELTTSKITRQWPALSPLEGDPRFEAIQKRMIEHLNSERQKLGLEPETI